MSEIKIKLSQEDKEDIAELVALKIKKDIKGEPRLYSVSDVARLLKCHKNTVLKHIELKILKASRKGKSWIISEEDFNNYIKNQE